MAMPSSKERVWTQTDRLDGVSTEYKPRHQSTPVTPGYWRPWILRLPSLATVFVFTVALIALVEVAIRKTPPLDSSDLRWRPWEDDDNDMHKLRKREPVPIAQTSATNPGAFANASTVVTISSSSSKSSSSIPTPTASTIPVAFAGGSTTFKISSSTSVVVSATTSVAFAGQNTAFSLSSPSAFSPSAAPPAQFAGLSTALSLTKPSIAYAGGSTYFSMISGSYVGGSTYLSISSGSYVGVQNTFQVSPTAPMSITVGAPPPDTYANTQTAFDLGSTSRATPIQNSVQENPAIATITSIASDIGSVLGFTDETTTATASPDDLVGIASETSSNVHASTVTVNALFNSQNPYYSPDQTPAQCKGVGCTVVVKYPPWASATPLIAVAIATILKTIWTCIHGSIRSMEPFALLSKSRGALAEQSLLSYYMSSSIIPDFISALPRRLWYLSVSSIALLVAGAIQSLASEILITDTHGCPSSQHSSNEANPCAPQLAMDRTVARLTQALLALIALITLLVSVRTLIRQHTGVHADPSSILTVASLAHHPQLFNLYTQLPPNSSARELHHALRGQRFKLSEYTLPDGTYRYGIYPYPNDPEEPLGTVAPNTSLSSGRTIPRYARDILAGVLAAAFLAVVIAYYLDSSNSSFNRFFNSDTFGPRFIMTGAATILSTIFTSFHAEVANKSIYATLAKGSAPASKALFRTRPSTPVTALLPAIIRGEFIPAVFALVAVLAEILTVAAAGVPFGAGQIWVQFLISAYVSMAVLGILVIAVGLLLWWRWKVCPELPREPDVVASVLGYVVESQGLREHCEGLECATASEKRTRFRGTRWIYGREGGVWKIEDDVW